MRRIKKKKILLLWGVRNYYKAVSTKSFQLKVIPRQRVHEKGCAPAWQTDTTKYRQQRTFTILIWKLPSSSSAAVTLQPQGDIVHTRRAIKSKALLRKTTCCIGQTTALMPEHGAPMTCSLFVFKEKALDLFLQHTEMFSWLISTPAHLLGNLGAPASRKSLGKGTAGVWGWGTVSTDLANLYRQNIAHVAMYQLMPRHKRN